MFAEHQHTPEQILHQTISHLAQYKQADENEQNAEVDRRPKE